MSREKLLLATLIALAVVSIILIFICNAIIIHGAKGRLYSDIKTIPYNKVGLLLGTSKYTAANRINPFYYYRIKAAEELLKNNKIKYLIISGDNGRVEYNEPETMRADLINDGIDSTVIYLDYAGFRTFDSMIRLKEIFGQSSVTVISQQFHNERAIYIASKANIDAIGFNAKDVSATEGFRTDIREKFARVKVFLDFWFGKKPKYLGKKITLPS